MYYLKLALEYFLLFGIFRITISQSTTNCESVNGSPDCSGVLNYALVPSENECQRTFLPLLRDLQSKLEMVVMHGDQLSYKILSKVSETNQNTQNLTNLKELTSTLFQLQNALEGQRDYSEYFQNISKANADTRNNLSSVLQEITAQVEQLTKANTGISVANITNIQNAITTLGSQIDDTLSQLNDKTSMLKNMTEVCNLHETVSAIIQSAMEELKQEINKSAASQCNALSKTHTTITAKSSTQHSSTTSTTPGQPIQDQTTKEQTAKEPTTQGPTTMKQTTHEPTTIEQVTQFQASAVPIPDNKMNSTEFAELRQLLSQLTSIAIAQEQKIDNLTTSLDEVKNVVTQQENIIKCLDKGCPPGFVKWRCSCYVAVNKSYNWYQARDNCGQMNGHLADISSYEEHNFLRTVIDSMWQTIGVFVPGYNSAFWLGGTEYELPPTTATSSTSASPSSAATETSSTSGVTTSSGSITPNENEITTVSSTSSETTTQSRTTSAMKDTDAMTHSMDSTSDSEITTVPSGTRSSMAPLSTPTTIAGADVNTHSTHSTKQGDSVITTVPPSTSGGTTAPKTSSTTIPPNQSGATTSPNQSGATTSPELTTSTVNQPTFTLVMDQTTMTSDTTLSGRKKRQASQDSKPVGWVWYHTDQPFTFTYWNPGEPNDWNNNEDCMAMAAYNADYRWNDYNCQSEYIASVCEIDLDQF